MMLSVSAALAAAAPPFLAEITVLIAISALVAYLCHRLGIMPIVAFLLTGAVLGPHALGLVRDELLIESAAELGVVLLLFTIGIEFSLEKLGKIRRLILLGGGLQVGMVTLLVTAILAAAGISWQVGVFTGFLVALSSTAIVMKMLMTRGGMETEQGQAALGVLIFQDLAVVAMVMLVPMLAGMGGSAGDIGLALVKAAAIVAVVLVAARRVMPRILEAVARTCSQEIFLLTVVGICLGTAYLTSLAGVSVSLGAFLAGLVVSESRFSQMALGEILPLQILFSAMFFVSVGLLLDVSFIASNPLAVLGVIAAVLLIKSLSATAGLLATGYRLAPAAGSAVILAQVGEFSFVLERAGREVGLYPAGVAQGGPETFIAATVALMIASPLLYRWGEKLAAGTPAASRRGAGGSSSEESHSVRSGHLIIAGFGPAGRCLAQALAANDIHHLVVTLSPEGAREAERLGSPVLRGNYTRRHELLLAGLQTARRLVIADDEPETTRQVVETARAINEAIPILVTAPSATDAEHLVAAGASEVLVTEREAILRLAAMVLAGTGADQEAVAREVEALRAELAGRESSTAGSPPGIGYDKPVSLNEEQSASDRCSHTDQAQVVTPGSPGCLECLELGWDWVHLRVCLTCGHVGCCNSSRGRHATKHYQSSGHPIMKSLEPLDDWAWCYEDQQFL